MPRLTFQTISDSRPACGSNFPLPLGHVYRWLGKMPPAHDDELFMSIYAGSSFVRLVSLKTGDTWTWEVGDDMPERLVPVTAIITVIKEGDR